MKGTHMIKRDYDPRSTERAKELRKHMTRQEKRLWYEFLSSYPIRFYRQRPIGKYIVDFYCSKAKTVIELDGGQHYTDGGKEYEIELPLQEAPSYRGEPKKIHTSQSVGSYRRSK